MKFELNRLPSWLASYQDALFNNFKRAQSLLIAGGANIGKSLLVESLIKTLFCSCNNREGFCGQCQSCHFMDNQTHPDCLFVQPEPGSQVIKVGQIRELIHFSQQTSHLGGIKVIWIKQAEKMNVAAQNTLLKTLEEPNEACYLILVSDNYSLLLPTLLSRLQKTIIKPPSESTLSQWLAEKKLNTSLSHQEIAEIVRDEPFSALQWSKNDLWRTREQVYNELLALRQKVKDFVPVSARWASLKTAPLYHWLLTWCLDCITLKIRKGGRTLVNRDYAEQLNYIVRDMDLAKLFAITDKITSLNKASLKQVPLNQQLCFDVILSDWMAL